MNAYPPIVKEVVYGKLRRSMYQPGLSGPTSVDPGHLHPVVESFAFVKHGAHYHVKDDYGFELGEVVRVGRKWVGLHKGHTLLDSDGGARTTRRRRDMAYRLLCVHLDCPALSDARDRMGIDSEATR